MRSEKVDKAIITLRGFRQTVRCASYAEIILSIDAVIDYIDILEQLVGDVDTIDTQFIYKDKVRELKEKVHKTLDANGITRAYQIFIDKDFEKLLGEQ